LQSESYTTSAICDNGIQSVREHSPHDSNYERKLSTSSQYFFNLKASNGKVIGTSEMYSSEANRENGISSVKRLGPTSPVDVQS